MRNVKLYLLSMALFIPTLNHAAPITDTITMCNDCHGGKGVSQIAIIPTIAGYSATTIENMLFAYVDETRPARKSKFYDGDRERPTTDMQIISKKLSADEISELAQYYGKQTFIAAKQPFDQELANNGEKIHNKNCAKCHSAGGSASDDDAGILAGQWVEYLEQAFTEYRSNKRETESSMQQSVSKLSDEQVQFLIHFYASQQ